MRKPRNRSRMGTFKNLTEPVWMELEKYEVNQKERVRSQGVRGRAGLEGFVGEWKELG